MDGGGKGGGVGWTERKGEERDHGLVREEEREGEEVEQT